MKMVDLGCCNIIQYVYGTEFPNNLTHLLWIWETLQKQGKTDLICPTMNPEKWGVEGFLKSIAGDSSHFWQIFKNEHLLGFLWIQNYKPKRAELHFGVIKFDRDYVRISKQSLAYLMEFYDLEVIFGYVPQHNKAAIRFVRKIGAEITGFIPNGSYKSSECRNYDSALFTYLKEKTR